VKILAISAHPDDETLGIAGTLLKHKEAGGLVHWMIVTQGHRPAWSAEVIQQKAIEVNQVAQAYGVHSLTKFGFPAARLDTVPLAEIIGRLRDAVAAIKPTQVYVVHGGDVHSDHDVLFRATMSALRPQEMERLGIRRLLCYETLSSTEAAAPNRGSMFVPNVFNDITSHLGRKIEIMGLYQSENQADPLPRGPGAMKALARYRGATIGVEYAEALMLVRELM